MKYVLVTIYLGFRTVGMTSAEFNSAGACENARNRLDVGTLSRTQSFCIKKGLNVDRLPVLASNGQ
ncbi:hypothetical protein JF546_04700 [Nitratireductor aquimarinus]|uniref:hypothetical protein n=1 Tax=Nitratireductor aquimarinus TaxID=889300 RepID=UPI001A8CD4D3|nr:hypothetical protein [Nitratireductor aquimarinus]MBN8242303.1 hypothetical protein [Nitratireductor aquimarinus]MBY6130689.1 hypothetical protein [Nitratireductor aquimarinus]MCA1302554.1 hypothetical protein [Nitratireductor aquimarinus]